MGGYTGYYTHLGDGGEHDLYEGETPVERQGDVTDNAERAGGCLCRGGGRGAAADSSASIIRRRIGHGRRPQLKRRRGGERSIGPKSSRADRRWSG